MQSGVIVEGKLTKRRCDGSCCTRPWLECSRDLWKLYASGKASNTRWIYVCTHVSLSVASKYQLSN